MFTYVERRVVNLPADQVYQRLLDYFTNHPAMKDLKVVVKHSSEPSYIDAEIGGWWVRGGPGVIEAKILPKENKSRIELNYNYKELAYVNCSFCAIYIMAFLLLSVFLWTPLVLIPLSLAIPYLFLPSQFAKRRMKEFMRSVDSFFAGIEGG